MRNVFQIPYAALVTGLAAVAASPALWAQAAVDRPPAILPLSDEPAAEIHAFAPIPEALARGVVIVQYRTQNFRVFPVFGMSAATVSPRVGHLHVSVDDGPGTWAHTSGDPIIVVGLKPGAHRIRLELADPTHRILAGQTVEFSIPEKGVPAESHSRH